MLNTSERSEEESRYAISHSPLLVNVTDAMRTLAVGRTKFYELVNDGEIELVKIGSKSCAVVATIEAYVDRLRTKGVARAA